MKKFIVFAALASIAIVGCAKKTQAPVANSSITEVAPPPPIHNGITPAAPIATTYSDAIVAPADDITPSRSAPSSGGGKTYIVKKGDTLWGIAQRTYGDGKQYRKIIAANPSIKGDRLNAGQKIVLPS